MEVINPINLAIGGAVLGLLILSNTFAYFKGRESIQGEYHEFKTEVAAAQARLQADAEAARLSFERTTQDVANSWAAVLGSVRTDYASRLRGKAASCAGAVRYVPVTTGELDAGPADPRPDPAPPETSYEQVCARLEADCAATTGQLIWLQHWASEVAK